MLIDETLDGIKRVCGEYLHPVVACSFGKDSLVMLDLVRRAVGNVPVVFHRKPFDQRKYAYANRVIEEWNLEVYDYPPADTAVQERDGVFEIVAYYDMGGGKVNYLPYNIVESERNCGLEKLYARPTARFAYPWDLCFVGNKNGDPDQYLGRFWLHEDVVHNDGSVSLAFPLRHWSDADVWAYIEERGLPIHGDRYEKVDGEWRNRDDITHNPDYAEVCTRCMQSSSPESVPCPRLGCMVQNVSSRLRKAPALELQYATTEN